jgi:hypothetical protein
LHCLKLLQQDVVSKIRVAMRLLGSRSNRLAQHGVQTELKVFFVAAVRHGQTSINVSYALAGSVSKRMPAGLFGAVL